MKRTHRYLSTDSAVSSGTLGKSLAALCLSILASKVGITVLMLSAVVRLGEGKYPPDTSQIDTESQRWSLWNSWSLGSLLPLLTCPHLSLTHPNIGRELRWG